MRVHLYDLEAFAVRAIECIQPGVPMLLFGPMGVGKSTLVRAILKKMIPDLGHVPSPSFPIMIPYDSVLGPIWHADLYRINSPLEIPPLGLEDVMRTDVCLIEWPERLGPLTPNRCHAIVMNFVDVLTEPADASLYRDMQIRPMIDGHWAAE